MSAQTSPALRPNVEIERTYEADVEDLWDLWTTKEGFEAWWGPEGFRVEVRRIEAREGGELVYDMIAAGAEQIAFMEAEGMPASHGVRSTFVEVVPYERLRLRSVIDFIPGVEPYDNDIAVELIPEGTKVRMVVRVDRHRDDEWTERAVAGFESQLTKLPAALAARRG